MVTVLVSADGKKWYLKKCKDNKRREIKTATSTSSNDTEENRAGEREKSTKAEMENLICTNETYAEISNPSWITLLGAFIVAMCRRGQHVDAISSLYRSTATLILLPPPVLCSGCISPLVSQPVKNVISMTGIEFCVWKLCSSSHFHSSDDVDRCRPTGEQRADPFTLLFGLCLRRLFVPSTVTDAWYICFTGSFQMVSPSKLCATSLCSRAIFVKLVLNRDISSHKPSIQLVYCPFIIIKFACLTRSLMLSPFFYRCDAMFAFAIPRSHMLAWQRHLDGVLCLFCCLKLSLILRFFYPSLSLCPCVYFVSSSTSSFICCMDVH